mgnify:CR=1 FL=1
MEDSRIQTFVPVQEIFVPNIMVLGAGGAGGNVVTRMVSEGVQNVRMVVCNTDQKALQRNKADVKIDLGRQLTRGMGAGARPEIGAGAAEDSIRDIENVIKGSHMIFIAAGMGGGTGTGAGTGGGEGSAFDGSADRCHCYPAFRIRGQTADEDCSRRSRETS